MFTGIERFSVRCPVRSSKFQSRIDLPFPPPNESENILTPKNRSDVLFEFVTLFKQSVQKINPYFDYIVHHTTV